MKTLKTFFVYTLFLSTFLTGDKAGFGTFLYFAGVIVAAVIFWLKFELREKDLRKPLFSACDVQKMNVILKSMADPD